MPLILVKILSKNWKKEQKSDIMRGSSHIRSALIGVEYPNQILDVYLPVGISILRANSIKTNL